MPVPRPADRTLKEPSRAPCRKMHWKKDVRLAVSAADVQYVMPAVPRGLPSAGARERGRRPNQTRDLTDKGRAFLRRWHERAPVLSRGRPMTRRGRSQVDTSARSRRRRRGSVVPFLVAITVAAVSTATKGRRRTPRRELDRLSSYAMRAARWNRRGPVRGAPPTTVTPSSTEPDTRAHRKRHCRAT